MCAIVIRLVYAGRFWDVWTFEVFILSLEGSVGLTEINVARFWNLARVTFERSLFSRGVPVGLTETNVARARYSGTSNNELPNSKNLVL